MQESKKVMNRMRVIAKANFKDIKSAYSNVNLENCVSLTQYVDSLIFKSRNISEILALVEEAKAQKFTESKDFKTCARIQAHINYRIKHDRLCVNVTKAKKVRYTKLDN